MEDRYLSQFVKIETTSLGFDFLFHPKSRSASYVVNYAKNKNIWTFASLDPYLSQEEWKVNENLAILISYFLNNHKKEFNKIFEDCGIDAGRIRISIFADSYIKRTHLVNINLINDLSPEKPIYFKNTYINASNIYEIAIIYSINDIEGLFNLENNNAERNIIKEFIKSLYSEFSSLNENEIEEVSDKFIDKNIPLDKPEFTLNTLQALNEGILDYSDPIETSKVEISNVKKLTSQFLRDNSKINPGSYSNNAAKTIIDEIFAYIHSELEFEIKKYDMNAILNFTYLQLEFLRKYRDSREIDFGIATQTRVKYDINEKKKEMLEEVIHRNNALQHLLETILKVDTLGTENPTIENFQYLEALSTFAFHLASISDLIYYDIEPHEITINSDYSFDLEAKEVIIDGNKYLTDYSKWGLKNDFTKFKRAKELLDVEKGETPELSPEYEDIEKAFETDFGFKYSEFLKVMGAMSRINPINTKFYPLTYLDQESLLNEIKSIINEDFEEDLSDSLILNIIDFISMDYAVFKTQNLFIPNLLRMNRNRFNLKPVIKISNTEGNYYLYGSYSVYSMGGIYSHLISTGRFPHILDEKTPLGTALKSMEELHNDDLEKKVENLAIKLFGEDNVEAKLLNFHRISKTFHKRPGCGEIDCLTIDINKKIIHVLEAKDVKKAVIPKEIDKELKKYFDPNDKNYAGKLIKKADFVSENLETFLDHFNISDKEGWKVNCAFVTYEVHMSASLALNHIEFIPISELEDYLTDFST